ncbi:MAG: PQQ-dependent catabolism-associated CXXCW motif protein [Hyphomicrobiales bacterium]|nr:MAG: PQQ-dependent catabolism-associated CXXCW motif protein [Hyphomicrobiales bacterium]
MKLALVMALVAAPALAEAPPEPDGYRGAPYSAPVPETLAGATVVDTEGAANLHRDGKAVFIDVMPRDVKPPDLPKGTIWRDKPRDSIPGAIWLPNTGFQALSAEEEAYLRAGLVEATKGNKSQPVVFFCRADCWMSWNAAKRALDFGYSHVIWYPEGPEGWITLPKNPPLQRVEPFQAL